MGRKGIRVVGQEAAWAQSLEVGVHQGAPQKQLSQITTAAAWALEGARREILVQQATKAPLDLGDRVSGLQVPRHYSSIMVASGHHP